VSGVLVVSLSDLSPEEREAVRSLARALSYFARERAYGYIDRLANAFSILTARHVLTEMLRDLKSERDRGADVWIPKGNEVEKVLEIAEKDLSILKVVASLALAYGW